MTTPLLNLMQGAAAKKIYATWNPADISANIILPTPLSAQGSNSIAYGSVRATQGKSTGKWYFETTSLAISGSTNLAATAWCQLGLIPATAALGTPLATLAIEVSMVLSGSGIYKNAVLAAITNSYNAVGHGIGVAVDFGAGTVGFYHANSGALIGTAKGITPDIYFPAVSLRRYSPTGIAKYSTNFGASPFTMAVPAGYNAGWYT
jgi:hypothetical protein